MAQAEDTSARFWEFYALRYSVGAVLGALILFILIKQNKPLSSLIFIKDGEPIDIVQAGIFLSIGLVYSYISSAPILVFHAGRFLIPKVQGSLPSSSPRAMVLFLISSFIPATLFALFSSIELMPRLWLALLIFIASAVMIGQLQIVFKCHSKRTELFAFYEKLASQRAKAQGGIVDSYRHLREHGNAFGIVLFEIILALFIFAATIYTPLATPEHRPISYETASALICVLILWITPASLMWLIACMIERDFVDS